MCLERNFLRIYFVLTEYRLIMNFELRQRSSCILSPEQSNCISNPEWIKINWIRFKASQMFCSWTIYNIAKWLDLKFSERITGKINWTGYITVKYSKFWPCWASTRFVNDIFLILTTCLNLTRNHIFVPSSFNERHLKTVGNLMWSFYTSHIIWLA